MSRRCWLPLIAAFGLVIGAYGHPIAYAQDRDGGAAQNQPLVQRVAPEQSAVTKADVERIAKALEKANTHADSAKEDRRAQDNLRTQQRMADSASNMFWVGFFELVTTAIGVGLVGWTLYHTRRAANAAERTITQMSTSAELELRAYISVEPLGIASLDDWETAIGHVGVKNVGKVPARNVFVQVRMGMSETRDTDFPVPGDVETIQRVIQPGASMRQGSDDAFPASQITRKGAAKHIYVYGVVYYDDGFGKRRFTRFCHRYASASHDVAWRKFENVSRTIVRVEKARYHTHGNEAD